MTLQMLSFFGLLRELRIVAQLEKQSLNLVALSLTGFSAYSYKRSSLVRKCINYGQKSFITIALGFNVIKLFTASVVKVYTSVVYECS